MIQLKKIALIIFAVMSVFTGCFWDKSSSDNNNPSTDASSSIFVSRTTVPPGEQCTNGGVQIDLGFDENNNSILDPEEIIQTEYVCNGEDGTDASSHPFAVYTSPSNNDTGVPVDTFISVVFNTDMDESTINEDDFIVKDEDGSTVDGAIEYNNTVATFTPADLLIKGTKYTVILSAAIENSLGIATGYEHKISFMTEIAVTGVELNKFSTVIVTGLTEQLYATISPGGAKNHNVTWESDNDSIAIVNSTGLVTAIAAGSATVTVTTEDGNFTADCSVMVFSAADTFTTTWNTAYTGYNTTESNQIQLPLYDEGIYDFYVAWGDGKISHVTSYDQGTTHTYPAEGTYNVIISGTIERFGFSPGGGDRIKLLDVEHWGNVKLHNNGFQFNYAIHLAGFSATDQPDLSNITSMFHMFDGACIFNGNIGSWDVSNVTNMDYMFASDEGSAFNQDISSWDVSKVTDMTYMFLGASSFNHDISSWNVGNVTSMTGMFMSAAAFNQNIGSWDVSKVFTMIDMFRGATAFNKNIGSWNVSNVACMNGMFAGATSFDQNVGSWNVSKVVQMPDMFNGATAFNQNIGSWNVNKVTLMDRMFYNASSFNQDLNSWVPAAGVSKTDMFTGSAQSPLPSWY